MSKRILAISNHSFMLGGGEHSFLDLFSHLSDPWDVLTVVPAEAELAIRLKNRGVRTEVIPLPFIRPWTFPHILSSLKTYLNLCRRYGPALIYANGSRAAFYGGIVGRILDLPVIWHCRMADPDLFLDFILRNLSCKIIANSRATAKRFKQPSAKVTVVYNGVDLGWLKDDSGSRPGLMGDNWKVILVVARVSRWKRHDLALTAFEEAAKTDPDAHLVCVGSRDPLAPDWWDYLQDRSRQSQYADRIHWVGQVEDVRPWYRGAYLLLLTSDNEPFGRVLVEAMACGVPVVATRSGGVAEIVRHQEDGFLTTPGDALEMADAMAELLKNESQRKRYARSAIKRADYFSLDVHVDKIAQVFEDVIHAKN